MFAEEKLSQTGRKMQQSIGMKHILVLNMKKTAEVNFLLKCSKKEKPEQERPMLYRMLLIFKTSTTYKIIL